MSDNEEVEIKVEFYESLEADPLCVNNEKLTCLGNKSISSDISDQNINQLASDDVNENLENLETAANDENYYPVKLSDEVTWYKSLDNQGRYLCKFCELSYSTIQTVRHHVKNKHTDHYDQIKRETVLNIRKCKKKCHVCKKRFKNSNDLEIHVRTHGIDKLRNSCFICHATFKENVELLIHVSREHKTEKKNLHFCITCGYSTPKLSHYKQHEKTHSCNDLKKCSFCEYKTYHLPNLKIHERIHTNEKPYICSFNGCSYQCAAKSALYSHQLKHDKEKNIVYCDKCSYKTVYKQSLKKHMDSHRRNCVRTRF